MIPKVPSKEIPPWISDGNPELWVMVKVAARLYFRRSYKTIRDWQKDGRLELLGMPTYWDGSRWWIRLPREFNPAQKRRTA